MDTKICQRCVVCGAALVAMAAEVFFCQFGHKQPAEARRLEHVENPVETPGVADVRPAHMRAEIAQVWTVGEEDYWIAPQRQRPWW